MNVEELRQVVTRGESRTVEFKKSLADLDRIVEVLCGFANTRGGTVFIGVRNSGQLIGVDISPSTEERLMNKIADNTEDSLSPKVDTIRLKKGKSVILLSVKESKNKPHTAFGRAFRRIGTVTKKMPKKEYDELVLEKNADKTRWDIAVCKGAAIYDLNKRKIRKYLAMREKERNIPAKLRMGLEQFLKNIGALTDRGEITNAGMAFFGKSPKRFILNVQLRLVRFKGVDRTGLILDKLDCQGVLWEMIDQGEEFIRKNIKLIGYIPKNSWRRKDTFDYPVEALREAIINAAIHRDYWQSGEVIVYIFDEHIDIVNHGGFPKGVTPRHPKHKPRNPLLSQYMYDIGYIEKFGSGIFKIREMCEENGNPPPEYETDKHSTVLTFKALEPQVTVEQSKEMLDLNDRQLKALDYARSHGSISSGELMRITKVTRRTAIRDLNDMVDKGYLIVAGAGRSRRYRPR